MADEKEERPSEFVAPDTGNSVSVAQSQYGDIHIVLENHCAFIGTNAGYRLRLYIGRMHFVPDAANSAVFQTKFAAMERAREIANLLKLTMMVR